MYGIPVEAWRALSGGRGRLVDLFNNAWQGECFPAQWKEALVVGIFKKGAADLPENYRPISRLQTAYKLYGRILTARLEQGLEGILRSAQYGFRHGRSTTQPMFILRRLQDLVHGKQGCAFHLILLDGPKPSTR